MRIALGAHIKLGSVMVPSLNQRILQTMLICATTRLLNHGFSNPFLRSCTGRVIYANSQKKTYFNFDLCIPIVTGVMIAGGGKRKIIILGS